jgi:hypothetical protein
MLLRSHSTIQENQLHAHSHYLEQNYSGNEMSLVCRITWFLEFHALKKSVQYFFKKSIL